MTDDVYYRGRRWVLYYYMATERQARVARRFFIPGFLLIRNDEDWIFALEWGQICLEDSPQVH